MFTLECCARCLLLSFAQPPSRIDLLGGSSAEGASTRFSLLAYCSHCAGLLPRFSLKMIRFETIRTNGQVTMRAIPLLRIITDLIIFFMCKSY